MSRQLVRYHVPGYKSRTVLSLVDDRSTAKDIIREFRNESGRRYHDSDKWTVAYVAKNHALDVEPISSLRTRFSTIVTHLKYANDEDKIHSLGFCDDSESEESGKIQFFIRLDADELEFIAAREERDHLSILRAASTDWSPSSTAKTASGVTRYQDQHPIYDGRPAQFTGPPIMIYEPIFAGIVDDLARLSGDSEHTVNEDISAMIGKFIVKSLMIYDSEASRVVAIQPLIECLLGVRLIREFPASSHTGPRSDAVSQGNGMIYLHVEYRNEAGSSEFPELQSVLTLLKHIAEPKYAAIRNQTCCPCIHLSICGPYITFGGSILTDTYNYQAFTDSINLGLISTNTYSIHRIARSFEIFRGALRMIRAKCRLINQLERSKKDISRLFPQPAYMEQSQDIPRDDLVFEGRFVPDGRQLPPRRALFYARFRGARVVVKFCEKYHRQAHEALAAQGLAPQLILYRILRGGLRMVVMEHIDTPDAFCRFRDEALPIGVVKGVRDALVVLHNALLVHGNVRRSNILVKAFNVNSPEPTWNVWLTDFTLVGEANKDRYSALLSTAKTLWPPGVYPGALMEKHHDELMLQKISRHDHADSSFPYLCSRII